MTRRRPTAARRHQTGDLPSADEIAEMDYSELVALECQINDRLDQASGVNFTETFCSMQHLHHPMMLRLGELAEDDPGVVRAVAAALHRRDTGRRVRGDFERAEARLALHAHRSAIYLTDTGTRSCGPFADL